MPALKVGDVMWWRGMRMEIFAVNKERGVFRYASVNALIEEPDWVSRDGEPVGRTRPAYIVASAVAEAKWDPDLAFWYMPGVQGDIPKAHIEADGTVEILDPEIPRCTCEKESHEHDVPHAAITFHRFREKVEEGEAPVPSVPYCTNCILADRAEVA